MPKTKRCKKAFRRCAWFDNKCIRRGIKCTKKARDSHERSNGVSGLSGAYTKTYSQQFGAPKRTEFQKKGERERCTGKLKRCKYLDDCVPKNFKCSKKNASKWNLGLSYSKK